MIEPERKRCEKCGKLYDYDRDDYCTICGRNLCVGCMETGCCGEVPALSGLHHEGSEHKEGEDSDA